MGITKNKQSEDVICKMSQVAFPNKQIAELSELTEGMCNAAYLLTFSDGSKSVLKIASDSGKGLMSNEVNMMEAEVRAMQIVHEAAKNSKMPRVAEVVYFDASNRICKGKYFFMEALAGQSFFAIGESLSAEEKNVIHYEVGQIQRELTSIHGETFGLLGDEVHKYTRLYDFVYALIQNVLKDAEKKQVIIGVETEEILKMLQFDESNFDLVTTPCLVHWDMWEGNIFVKDKHVSGIIDWERAMWGEAFMDDRFRRHTRHPEFLKGYGQEVFSEAEMRRIYWYDVFLYLTMMVEGAYREYEDDSQYQWVKPLFEASYDELCKGKRKS